MSIFKTLFEHVVGRIDQGGIQLNDYVKIKNVDIEGVSDEFKNSLKELKDGDLNLKILGIGLPDGEGNGTVVIGQEMASGIYPKKFTVPVTHLEVVGHNTPPSIPDSWKVVSTVDNNGDPKELNKDLESYSKSKM